ncbi:hypothetical protein Cgig2_010816 [Carnegiea gigantea]|uniref:Tetraspanin-19-like n=1 Tax=Carnegiea gigantea TaxID=171969 RepID=A0A9Q1JPZ5_9CARY|nr:hypothetical protein Cgig2_010816 [Carnegiea gigantea]
MGRSAKKIIKTALNIANLILCIVGITILLYSLWMIMVVLRRYRKYFFSSWFLWATIATGIMFCFSSCIGFAAAATRCKMMLTSVSFNSYIVSISLLLLMEILIMGDVSLNDDWDKDFPEDPAQRFDDFVDFVESNSWNFRTLVFLIFLVQVAGFGLAMALRLMRARVRSYLDNDPNQVSAALPFLAHPVGPANPYVMGHPFPAAQRNVEENKREVKDAIPNLEKDVWSRSSHGFPFF